MLLHHEVNISHALINRGLTLSQMTSLRLFQTEGVCNLYFDENGVVIQKGIIHCWKGEIAC